MIDRRLGLSWFCNARADQISAELATAMAEAGCHQARTTAEALERRLEPRLGCEARPGPCEPNAARALRNTDTAEPRPARESLVGSKNVPAPLAARAIQAGHTAPRPRRCSGSLLSSGSGARLRSPTLPMRRIYRGGGIRAWDDSDPGRRGGQAYLGFESGSPEILRRIRKGCTVEALEVSARRPRRRDSIRTAVAAVRLGAASMTDAAADAGLRARLGAGAGRCARSKGLGGVWIVYGCPCVTPSGPVSR